jgi:hypothetical protein
MSAEDALRDACWVLTVVGGLALTKALEEALPALNFSQWSDSNLILLLRLFIFCAIGTRLFIGASVYFQQVHLEAGHASKFPESNYVVDFACCIVHFSLLYFMAVNVRDVPAQPYLPQQRFFLALCAVTLYDWVWFLLSSAYSTARTIKKWAIPNTVTAVVYVFCFLLFRYGIIDRTWFEVSLTLATLLFSLPDGIKLKRGRLP